MKLIIIQGEPATGKTTLTHKLAKDLSCGYFSKDEYKEQKFDELKRTPSVKEWFRIDHEARSKLYDAVMQRKHEPLFIVENCFGSDALTPIRKALDETDAVYEIFCHTKGFTSIKRFHSRNKLGNWHKGHRALSIGYPLVAWMNFRSIIGLSLYKPLGLSKNILKVDTTDFSQVDYQRILEFVRS